MHHQKHSDLGKHNASKTNIWTTVFWCFCFGPGSACGVGIMFHQVITLLRTIPVPWQGLDTVLLGFTKWIGMWGGHWFSCPCLENETEIIPYWMAKRAPPQSLRICNISGIVPTGGWSTEGLLRATWRTSLYIWTQLKHCIRMTNLLS